MGIQSFSKLGCLEGPTLTLIHSDLLTVELWAALCPGIPSCLPYLLALPFNYAVIASPSRVSACTLHT